MRNWLRRRRRWVVALVVASVAASLAVVWWQWPDGGDYTTEDMWIEVDGDEPVELDARLYLPEEVPAPAVLLAHGFGGDKESVAESAEALAERGYVVLTYTARGFGASGGMVHLNSPEHEVADAAGLLDVLAERDDVVQDGPGDPRAAAVGGSYGGALSLLLAGHDERVDAIVPQITWHSLAEALFPNAAGSAATAAESGVYKRAWAGLFYAAGLAGGMPDADADADADAADQPPPDPEQLAAADPACGRWAPQVCAMYQNIAASGELDEDARTLLHDSSPESILDQITAPTLLIQGQADTLFDLEQADANADGIVNAPVRTAWYSGGHDAMGTPADQDRVDGLTAQWLDRYLLGEGDEPGDSFTFTRIGGVNSSSSDLSTIGMVADQYPGTSGRGESAVLESEEPVEPQQVASPPGGEPAALSALPSMGQLSALAGDGAAQDIPGQFASVDIPSGGTATDVVGAPEAQLRVASETGEAVLFVKLYDVDPSGRAQLPNGLVAPVRLTDLPADIADAEPTTVRLPPIVHRLEAGHSLRLVAATSDQAYAGPVEPAEYTVQMPDEVSLPQTVAQPLPSQDAVWSAALLVLAVGIPVGGFAAWLIARFRHSRRDRGVESEIADVPLTVRDLRKVYQDGFVAVEKVSFSVQRGQVVGLLGPNGAGKTTSLRALMGLLQPTAGQIRVFGRQVAPGAPVLSRLGALVEGPGLLPHLSGLDNLRLFWRATGRPEADARLDEVVDIADLGNRIHRKVRTYSHGMKQRVAVAQAMLGMPDLLVLDEPTDGLDPPQIAEMRRVLHEYTADGRAVLVSSHLLAEVEQTCTHVVVLSRGNVVAAGEVAAVIGTGNGHRLEDAFLELVQ